MAHEACMRLGEVGLLVTTIFLGGLLGMIVIKLEYKYIQCFLTTRLIMVQINNYEKYLVYQTPDRYRRNAQYCGKDGKYRLWGLSGK